jgi:hypothetical protein
MKPLAATRSKLPSRTAAVAAVIFAVAGIADPAPAQQQQQQDICGELTVKVQALSMKAANDRAGATTPEGRCAAVGQALGLMQATYEVSALCLANAPMGDTFVKMFDDMAKALEQQLKSQCR